MACGPARKHVLLGCVSPQNKSRWAELASPLPATSHLGVALEGGLYVVHGCVEDVYEPVGSQDVPLYNFDLLFAPMKFELYLIVLKYPKKIK